MEVKKNPKVDAKTYRNIFFLAGMCLSLSIVYGFINYKKYDKTVSEVEEYTYEEEEVEVEQTVQEEEPPPPPEAPPQLEIVEDDVEIEDDQPEIEDTDTDDDEKIETIDVPDEEPEETDEVFEFYQVQQKAQFRGGQKKMYEFIGKNLEYPQMALDEGIEGRVTVQFVVGKNGEITNVTTLGSRKLGFGCEEAAMAVVKKMSGLWSPALQRDKPVKMRFVLPIRFQAVN